MLWCYFILIKILFLGFLFLFLNINLIIFGWDLFSVNFCSSYIVMCKVRYIGGLDSVFYGGFDVGSES